MKNARRTSHDRDWALSTFYIPLYITETCKKLLFIKYRYSEKAKNSPIYTTIWIDRCNSQHHAQTYRKFYFNEFVANVLHDNMGSKKKASNLRKKWGHFLVLHIKNLGSE